MPNVNFVGIIHPRSGDWWLEGPVLMTRGGNKITMHLFSSSFNVQVETPDAVDVEDAEALDAWANGLWYDTETAIRTVLDSFGFLLATSLNVELVSGTFEGKGIIFARNALHALATVQEGKVSGDQHGAYLGKAVANPNIRHALADMRMATQLSDDTAFYCYRAIESLRQDVLVGDDDNGPARKRSWEDLQVTLGVTQQELSDLAKHATPRRHGGDVPLAHQQRIAYLRRTRELVSVYIEQLPESAGVPNLHV